MKTSALLVLTAAFLLIQSSGVKSAQITWLPIIDITSPEDINLNGQHVEAKNATIDGLNPRVQVGDELIQFDAMQFPTATTGTASFFSSGGDTGNQELNQMLDSHSFGRQRWSFVLTGLQQGSNYQIQIIAGGDTRGGQGGLGGVTQRAGDGESPESFSGNMTRGGVGSAIGTFVANGSTQRIFMHHGTENAHDPALSGYVLRILPPPSPPSDIDLSHSHIDPGIATGQIVSFIDGTDPNNDTIVYSLDNEEDFPDNLNFTIINGDQLRATSPLDGIGTTYEIQIRASDPGGLERAEVFTLSVVAHPGIDSISRSEAGGTAVIRLTVGSAIGRTVGLAFSPDMSEGSWIELGNFFGTNGSLIFDDSDLERYASQKGFYRSFYRPLAP